MIGGHGFADVQWKWFIAGVSSQSTNKPDCRHFDRLVVQFTGIFNHLKSHH
jgi:hypothetical protein